MPISTPLQPACLARIDTIGLRHNYAKLKQHAKQAQVLALLKANAYGHGLLTIAKALPDADAFGVARIDEAIQLRAHDIPNRIVILGGLQHAQEWLIADKLKLDVVIHQSEQLQACEDFCSGLEPTQQCGFNLWIKFDTGMHRLGFSLKELLEMKSRIGRLTGHFSNPIVVMSHFANAEDTQDPLNRAQVAAFESIRDTFLSGQGDFACEFAMSNSGALLSEKTEPLDWVRPGLALYGVVSYKGKTGADFGLKPVMSLESRLIATKIVSTGEGVGYGQIWKATKTTRIGIASIGYGDGYPWQAESGTPVIVNGIKCNLVGRVSMDLLAIDLSNAPEAGVGSLVQLWGDQLPVEIVAEHSQTIPYTLLCGITQRVAVDVF